MLEMLLAAPAWCAEGSDAIAKATVAALTSSRATPWRWQGILVTTGIVRRLGILS